MNITNVHKLWLVAILFIAAAGFTVYQRYWHQHNFKCESELHIADTPYSYQGLLSFTFDSGEGRYDAKGTYQEGNKPTQEEKLSVLFRYWQEGDNVIMVSDLNNASVVKSIPAFNFPDFFVSRGRGLIVKMHPINSNAVLLLVNEIPVLVCHRVR